MIYVLAFAIALPLAYVMGVRSGVRLERDRLVRHRDAVSELWHRAHEREVRRVAR